jgi:hypothetical protein
MKRGASLGILIVFYIISVLWAFYIGRWETVYGAGAGAGVVIFMQGSILVLSVVLILLKWGVDSSLKASFILGTVLNLILILGHEISEYQPTRSIVIPDHYDGCVHLFVVNGPRDNVYVDDRGFGYIGSEGKVNWEIRRGGKNITNAWNTSHGNEICYDDGPQLICYDVLCLEIGPEDHYPEEHIDPYGMVKCMNHYEFLDLVRLGWIDESQLRKRVWDADRSRLNQAESRLGDL